MNEEPDSDEMLLLKWLHENLGSPRIVHLVLKDIKNQTPLGRHWIGKIREWSLEGIEGATAALNAAERIYGRHV